MKKAENVCLLWVFGYRGQEGNKEADKLAREEAYIYFHKAIMGCALEYAIFKKHGEKEGNRIRRLEHFSRM